MRKPNIEHLVIAGGGTAGWLAAASLSKFLGPAIRITLVESEAIGTVGVGEATIPQIIRLIGTLGLNEAEVMRASKATFKLGIEFNNWGQIGDSYLHTFGHTGINLTNLDFHHYWLRARLSGHDSSLWDYSIHNRAAYAGQFAHMPKVGNTSLSGLAYAFHFDSSLFGRYLRRFSESNGVTRVEGRIENVSLDGETGHIQSLAMEDGSEIKGDFFIDCTGFQGLLIGRALSVGYQDWANWLPCDRAVALGTAATGAPIPYTKATAHQAGWQWRIPLQHRTGNGHVYCSEFMEPDHAENILREHVDGAPLGDAKHIRFTTGRRDKFWHKNCLALGLASGFMEPLESTSIHLIQAHISKFIELFPSHYLTESVANEFNRYAIKEFECIRDFLILHYKQTQRDDSEFWRYCRNMDVPDTLSAKMQLFKETGIVHKDPEDIFQVSSWVQVMVGQGLLPENYHAMADRITDDQLTEFLGNITKIIDKASSQLPSHSDYIARYCAAEQ